MSDSFDGSDSEFNETALTFSGWLATHGASVGVSSGDVSAIAAKVIVWTAKYAGSNDAQTAVATAISQKDTTRDELEALMRPAALKVRTPDDRTAAGLNVYAVARDRVPVPTTRPVLMINNAQRLQQVVEFRDEATPDSRKKPDGVRSMEVRCYVGDTPPADPEEFMYCGNDTSTPYLLVHDAADAKKNAHVVGRWINSRQEAGPWSETVMATISA